MPAKKARANAHIEAERRKHAEAIEPLWARATLLWSEILNASEGEFTHSRREALGGLREKLLEHLKKLAEYGISKTTPNIHLIRHVAHKLNVTLP